MRQHIPLCLAAIAQYASLSVAVDYATDTMHSISKLNRRDMNLTMGPGDAACMKNSTGNPLPAEDAPCYQVTNMGAKCQRGIDLQHWNTDLGHLVPQPEEKKCFCEPESDDDNFWKGWEKCNNCYKENGGIAGEDYSNSKYVSAASSGYCAPSQTAHYAYFMSEFQKSYTPTAAAPTDASTNAPMGTAAEETAGTTTGAATEDSQTQSPNAALPTGMYAGSLSGVVGAGVLAVAAVL